MKHATDSTCTRKGADVTPELPPTLTVAGWVYPVELIDCPDCAVHTEAGVYYERAMPHGVDRPLRHRIAVGAGVPADSGRRCWLASRP